MRAVKQALVLIFLVIVIIIMIQNAQPTTTFKFLNWSYQVSQLLLVVIVFTIGFLTGVIVAKVPRRKKFDEAPVTQVRR